MTNNDSHTPLTPAPPAIVVMAKRPIPSHVKTRLTPTFSPLKAAQIHAAMLDCVLNRLAAHIPGKHILALDSKSPNHDQTLDPTLDYTLPDCYQTLDQGLGSLGDRLTHVWQALNQGPAVFFGVDSPDIPINTLKTLFNALKTADAAIGPVDDGGYYCLAAKQLQPPLLTRIDWGTPAVYHQTHQAAKNAGLKLFDLPPWHDVDTPADLLALQYRIKHTHEPTLARLHQRLHRITQDTTR
jgi:uncharacterized protein